MTRGQADEGVAEQAIPISPNWPSEALAAITEALGNAGTN